MKKTLRVTGLDCAHCAMEFENIIKNSKGIEDARINFILEKMIVTSDSEKAIEDAIKKAKKSFPDAEVE